MGQAGGRPARRQPTQPLSRERVLGAALALADAEGLKAVTMRRLASELGVEAMSLYHHLPGKEGLLDGLVDSLITQIEQELAAAGSSPGPMPGTAALHWRAAVRRRCLTAREVMVRHPWGPALITSRPGIPAAAYRYFDALLGSMVGGGLSYQLAHRALHALGSLPLGFAQELFGSGAGDAVAGDVGPGGDPGENGDGADDVFARMAELLPHLTAMVASEIHRNDGDVLGWCDSRAEFEFTLDLLLDGLERAARAELHP